MFSILNSYDYKNQFTEKKLELPFLGEYESLEDFKFIYIYAYSDQSDTLELQFSNNQNDINYEFVETYNITGGKPPIEIILPKRLRYFRSKITTSTFNKNDRRTFSIFLFDSQYIKTTITTDPSGSPVVAIDANIVSSVLPDGAATENTLLDVNSSINTTNTTLEELTLEQNSTTASQKGPLIQGAISAVAPTYTTGKTNPLSLTTAGALRVDNSAVTQPISGTVNVSNAFATELTLQELTLQQNSTTTSQTGPLIQGAISAVAPTYITGRTNPLSLTTAGALRVDNSAVTQPISGTVNVSNAFATELTLQELTLQQNSTTTSQTGPLIQAATTTLAPTYTNGRTNPLSLTTSGALRVDNSAVTQPISGTVSVSNAFATELTLQELTLQQNSTTTSQTGPLIQGAISTVAPTYTTGKTNPLSLTTSGALRVDNSAVTQPISGTVSVSNAFATELTLQELTLQQNSTTTSQTGPLIQGATTTLAPTYTSGKTNPLSLTTTGALRVETQQNLPYVHTIISNAITPGYVSSSFDASNYTSFDILVSVPGGITSGGDFYVEVSDDNITWYRTNISISISASGPSTYFKNYSNTLNTQYVRIYASGIDSATQVITVKLSFKK
jgi:hypothetical protein